MSNGYLTHFAIILALHLGLLFGGASFLSSDLAKSNMPKLGKRSLTMTMSQTVEKKSQKVHQTRPKPGQKIAENQNQKTQQEEAAPDSKGEVQGHELGSENFKRAAFDVVNLYKAELRAKIDKNKYYPPLSRRLGQTGVVVVAFTLLADGNIIDIRIETPSRYERLNVSALDAVRKVHRFKPIPKELGDSKMDIKVPLKFVTI